MHFTEIWSCFAYDKQFHIFEDSSDIELKGFFAFVFLFDKFFEHNPRNAIVRNSSFLMDDDKPDICEDKCNFFLSLVFD